MIIIYVYNENNNVSGTKLNDSIIITTRLFRLMQQHFVINVLQ
jgi:hypothetical protein